MRHQQLNALFLLLALIGFGFGIFGMLHGGPVAATPTAVIFEADTGEKTESADALEANPGAAPGQIPDRVEPDKPRLQPKPAASETVEEAPELPDWQGKIFGCVVDQNGAPLVGVGVSAVDHDVLSKSRPDWHTDAAEIETMLKAQIRSIHHAARQTETDADGNFELTRLNPDQHYEVSANCDERGSESYWKVACGTELLIILDASSLIVLKVSDPEGQPINKVLMRSFKRGSSMGGTENGRNGTYYVRWDDSYEFISIGANGFIAHTGITAEHVGKTVNITLQRAPVISGVVSGRDGSPLSDAGVWIRKGVDRDGADIDIDKLNWDNEVGTDTTGRYRIDWLPPGTYTLVYRIGYDTSTAVTREVALESDTELDVQLDTGAHLTLRVTNSDGKPVTSFSTNAYDENRERIRHETLPMVKLGELCLIGLPKQKFRLIIHTSSYAPYDTEVDTAGGDVELDIVLTPGASLKGRILNTQGEPLEGMRLRWTPTGKDPGVEPDIWTYTKDDGSYSVGPLEPGTWVVDFYLSKRLADKVASQTVQLAAGEMAQDLILESPRTLNLQLKIPDGESLNYVDVYVRKEDEADTMRFYLKPGRGETSCSVPFLPAGNYLVYATGGSHSSRQYEVALQSGVTTCNLELGAPDCLRITSVSDNSSASLAGLKKGDLVLEYDYQVVSNMNDLVRLTKAADGRADVCMKVNRDGNEFELTLKGGLLGITAAPAKR